MSQTYFCLHDDAKLDGKELDEELLNKQNNIVAICPACSIPQCQLVNASELTCKCGALFIVIKSTAKCVPVKDVTTKIGISLASKKHFYVLDNAFIEKFAHKNLYGFHAKHRLPTVEAVDFYKKLDEIKCWPVCIGEKFDKFISEDSHATKYSVTYDGEYSENVLNLAVHVESYNLFTPKTPYPKQLHNIDNFMLCLLCEYNETKFVYSRV